MPANILTGSRVSVSDKGPGLVLGNTYYYRVRATGAPADVTTNPVAVTLAAGGNAITYGGSANVQPGADNNINTPGDNQIQLTPAINDRTGTAFFTNARDVVAAGQGPAGSAGFTSSFDFVVPDRSMNGPDLNGADGFTFVIQCNNNKSVGGGGGSLGYQDMPNSIGLEFDFYQGGTNGGGVNATNSTGLYLNGSQYVGNDTVSVGSNETGLTFSGGHSFHVDLSYNDATKTLTETIKDLTDTTLPVYTKSYTDVTDNTNNTQPLDLAGLLGGKFAFVGFTGATGGLNADQRVMNWKFDGADVPIAPAAQVPLSAVYIKGSAWTTAFKQYLEAKGLGDDVYGYKLFANGAAAAGPRPTPRTSSPGSTPTRSS